MSQNNVSVSLHVYTRSRLTTKSNNCSLVKLKENCNKNSLSVFLSTYQACNKLSAAVVIQPLAQTLGGGGISLSSHQGREKGIKTLIVYKHFFPRELYLLFCKNFSQLVTSNVHRNVRRWGEGKCSFSGFYFGLLTAYFSMEYCHLASLHWIQENVMQSDSI